MTFKRWLIGINGSKLWQKKQTFRTVDTRQVRVGFMNLCCRCQFLTLPSVCFSRTLRLSCFSSLRLSNFAEPVPAAASALCSWLTEEELRVGAHPHVGSKCCAVQDSILTIVQDAQDCRSLVVFVYCAIRVNSRDNPRSPNQQLYCRNTQISLSDFNNHATVEITEITFFIILIGDYCSW